MKLDINEIRERVMNYKLQQILDSGETDMFDDPIQKNYSIIYCFLKSDGSVQTDDYGCEMYHRDEIEAPSDEKAKEKFMEQFIYNGIKPEIVDIIRR